MGEPLEMARLAYQSVRAEILLRLTQREQVMLAYLGASITFFGILVAHPLSEPITKVLIGSVGPIAALVTAMIVSQHTVAIEALASFIRHDFNQFLIDKGGWAPHWELFSRKGYLNAEIGASTRTKRWQHLASIHLISILSMFYTTFVIIDYSLDASREYRKLVAMIGIEIVAVGVFFLGIWVTVQAVKSREITDQRLDKLMKGSSGVVQDIQIPKQHS